MTSEQIQGIPAAGGSQPLLIIASMQLKSKVYDKYVSRTSSSTGSGQIIIGGLCIIFNIVALAVNRYSFSFIGHGIWCRVMFIVTGSFGISAGKHKTKGQIIPYLVLCIISASWTIALMGAGILGAIAAKYDVDVYTRICNNSGNHDYPYYNPSCSIVDGYRVGMAMLILLCISGFIEAVLAIKGATNGCRSGICCVGCEGCCCVSDPPTVIPVGYLSNKGQLICINQTEAVPYVSSPQTVMSGPGSPPPPNVPSGMQFGWSGPPPQPPPSGVPSTQAEHELEYTADFSANNKIADDELLLLA